MPPRKKTSPPLWLSNRQRARYAASEEPPIFPVPGTPQRIVVEPTRRSESEGPTVVDTDAASSRVGTLSVETVATADTPLPRGNDGTEICAICLDTIIDATEVSEGEDALFCEGKCQAWLHRRCACITKARFDRISTSEAPFRS